MPFDPLTLTWKFAVDMDQSAQAAGPVAATTDGQDVVNLVDLSGNGNHAPASSSAAFKPALYNGHNAIRFTNDKYLTPTIFDSSFDTSLTVVVVAKMDEGTLLSNPSFLLQVGTVGSGGAGYDFEAGDYNSKGSPTGQGGEGDRGFPQTSALMLGIMRYDGVNFHVRVNGAAHNRTGTASLGFSGALTIGQRSDEYSGLIFSGDLCVALVGHAISDADVVALESYYLDRFGITAANIDQRTLRVYEGDSLTTDYPGGHLSYPDHMLDLFPEIPKNGLDVTVAQPGNSLDNLEARAATVDALISDLYERCVLFVNIGTNPSGANAAAQYAQKAAYCAARQVSGWLVVNDSIPASAHDEARRISYNQLDRDNWQNYADAFADIGADAIMGDYSLIGDTTYRTDSTHPTDAGAEIFAQYNYDAYRTLDSTGEVIGAVASRQQSVGGIQPLVGSGGHVGGKRGAYVGR